MKVDRVMIDTNMIVSGLAFGGNPARLFKSASNGIIDLLIPMFVVKEAEAVVGRRFPHLLPALNELLDTISYEEVPTPPKHLIEQAASMLRDPDDAEILACAMAAKPDVFITGDKDLLTKEILSIVPACRCADYLRKVGMSSGG